MTSRSFSFYSPLGMDVIKSLNTLGNGIGVLRLILTC